MWGRQEANSLRAGASRSAAVPTCMPVPRGTAGHRPSRGAATLAALRDKRIVVLPDVFVDVLAFLPAWRETATRLRAIARRGGGNLPVSSVEVKIGGNAANLALALARLGARVDLISETDRHGLHLLRQAARGTALGTERVRVGDRSSVTLGLECRDANLMLSHAGPLADFGPERLGAPDWRLLENADGVAFVNWAQNERGTDLLRGVASFLGEGGPFLYVDTGDPRNRLPAAQRLLKEAAIWKRVGALGLNENELGAFTGDPPSLGADAARRLAGRLGTRLDLHTRRWAATITANSVVQVPADASHPKRLTGAGDVWNAGNMAGHVLGWSARDRLRLAHRVATKYVTSPDGLPPTADEVA